MIDRAPDSAHRPHEAASYIESLVAELARMAATNRLHMLHYLLEMAREEAATISRRARERAAGD